VRWQHPELGLVAPSDFIPLAEATGLISQIGLEVLRTACRQNKYWQTAGLPPLRLAVNLSPHQFQQPELLMTIESSLRDAKLDPSYLGVEITESSVMQDREGAIATLRALRGMGVSVAIDDFGTGYCSLGYLKHLPVDTLKIDRSFLHDMVEDQNDAAIVRAIVTLGHSLNLKVTAEGVETEEQLLLLRRLECDQGQGYLYWRPLQSEAFEMLLRKGKGAKAE
jgi:EAL domain-containing protein (putative c-di-GMP-specific phosphodiesterase class I)